MKTRTAKIQLLSLTIRMEAAAEEERYEEAARLRDAMTRITEVTGITAKDALDVADEIELTTINKRPWP